MKIETLLKSMLLIALISDAARADDACDALLRNGINNIQKSKGNAAAISTNYFNHCSSNLDAASDEMLAQAEVSIFGVGSGEGKFDKKSSKTKIEEWCKTNKNYAEQNKNSYFESSTISKDALVAWQQCKSLQVQQEVDVKSVINENLDRLTIVLRYRGASPSGVKMSPISVSNWKCDGNYNKSTFSNDVYLKSEPITISCERTGFIKDFKKMDQSYEFWPAAAVQFAAGAQPLNYSFVATYDPPLPQKNADKITNDISDIRKIIAPVGAVIPFFLSDEEAVALKPFWMIADGQKIEDENSPLNGTLLPDLRNRFVLGSKIGDQVNISGIKTIGGSSEAQLTADLSKSVTANENKGPNHGRRGDNTGGPFVIDTTVDETFVANHTHNLTGSVPVTGNFMPPFRKLLYMVRAR